MTDRTGQQLGNYRLLRLLGRGGFATVYLGEHIHLNTLAAIKVPIVLDSDRLAMEVALHSVGHGADAPTSEPDSHRIIDAYLALAPALIKRLSDASRWAR